MDKRQILLLLLIALITVSYSCQEMPGEDKLDKQENTITYMDQVDYGTANSSNDEFSGSYLIDNNNRYQSIFSSQNYDTFYQIYCKAEFLKEENGDEYVESFKFRIVNYKGPLNIGFANSDTEKDSIDYDSSTKTIGLKLVVRGASTLDSLHLNVKGKRIKKNQVNKLNVYRILMPLNDDIRISKLKGIFDFEYYYRSGLGQPIRRKPVPGRVDYPADSTGGFKMSNLTNNVYLMVFGDSGKCYTSSIYVQ